MTTALVVGLGAVGVHATRQLIDTPGVDRLLLADRDAEQLADVGAAFGADAQGVDFTPGDPIPDDVDVVVTALPAGVDHPVVTAAIAAGVPVASSEEEHEALDQLRALDPDARGAGTRWASVVVSRRGSWMRWRDTPRRCSTRSRRSGWRARAGRGPRASPRFVTNAACRSGRGTTARGARTIPTATASCGSRSRSVPRLPHRHRRDSVARRRLPRRRAHRCAAG